jgi:hypothetical protein
VTRSILVLSLVEVASDALYVSHLAVILLVDWVAIH